MTTPMNFPTDCSAKLRELAIQRHCSITSHQQIYSALRCLQPPALFIGEDSFVRPVGDIIWCGVSAPVVQGVFVGLGVSVVGLIVFPFAFIPNRPTSGIQSNYHRTTKYLKWSRRAAWALGLFAGITLGGY